MSCPGFKPPPAYGFKDVLTAATNLQNEQQQQPSPNSLLEQPQQLLIQTPSLLVETPSPLPIYSVFQTHEPIGIYFYSALTGLWLGTSQSLCLHYIHIQSLRKPSLSLHATANPKSVVIATADYHLFSSTTDLCIAPATTTASKPTLIPLTKISHLAAAWAFSMLVPSTKTNERFLWKRSAGGEVMTLGPITDSSW
jgi:hypothetical protein